MSGVPTWVACAVMASQSVRELPAADRRTVFLAVRSGERVDDPRLRPAAVDMAQDLMRSTRRWEWVHRHRRWAIGILAVPLVLGLVVLLAGDHSLARVVNVVVGLLFLVVFLVVDPLFDRLRRNAALAAERNRDGEAESPT